MVAVVPAGAIVGMRTAWISFFLGIFATQMYYMTVISRASVEHWRLLRAIINWDSVASLLADSAQDSGSTSQSSRTIGE